MKDLDSKGRLQISASVRVVQTQDGAVLLDVKQGLRFSLNPVGALIWGQIGAGCGASSISQHLADSFNISLDQASSDVIEFLQELKRNQLVTEHDGNPETSSTCKAISTALKPLQRLLRISLKR